MCGPCWPYSPKLVTVCGQSTGDYWTVDCNIMTTQMVRACDNSGHHVLLIIKKKSFGIGTKIVWNRCVGFGTLCELITQYFLHLFLCIAIFVLYLRLQYVTQQLSPNTNWRPKLQFLPPNSITHSAAVEICSQKAGPEREPIQGVTWFTLAYPNYSFL